MCQSQCEGIVKVLSFHRTIGGEDLVNDYLAKGWVLLAGRIIEHSQREGESASVVYVLGRKEKKEE